VGCSPETNVPELITIGAWANPWGEGKGVNPGLAKLWLTPEEIPILATAKLRVNRRMGNFNLGVVGETFIKYLLAKWLGHGLIAFDHGMPA
jgi:hypothetical protein